MAKFSAKRPKAKGGKLREARSDTSFNFGANKRGGSSPKKESRAR